MSSTYLNQMVGRALLFITQFFSKSQIKILATTGRKGESHGTSIDLVAILAIKNKMAPFTDKKQVNLSKQSAVTLVYWLKQVISNCLDRFALPH